MIKIKRPKLDVLKSLISPYGTINFACSLFKPQAHPIKREDYIISNTILINKLGSSAWLSKLIKALSRDVEDKSYVLINPVETIKLSSKFQGQHQTIIGLDDWLKANTKLIAEIGPEQWLSLLLDVLTS